MKRPSVAKHVGESPADGERTLLRFLAEPGAVDRDGRWVTAGAVLEWIDRAGFACAARWSQSYCVTAYVGDVRFTAPIAIGHLVEVSARIIATGRTSMQVLVAVRAADPTGGDFVSTARCLLVFVAVDDERRPRPVRPWSPTTILDLDLADRAERRLEVRARIRGAMQAQQFSDAGTTPRVVLRFLASPRDVNWGGSVHGGTVMRWIDEAVQTCATGWTRRHTVSVYAGGIQFHSPIAIGDLVEVEARVIHTSRRSLHVSTRVRATDPSGGVFRTTTEALTIAVVRGDDGRAEPIAQVPMQSDEDRRLDALAVELVALRNELDRIDEHDLGDHRTG